MGGLLLLQGLQQGSCRAPVPLLQQKLPQSFLQPASTVTACTPSSMHCRPLCALLQLKLKLPQSFKPP